MRAYKSQLCRCLADHGWELVEKIASEEWWAEEFWKIQSRRNMWGLEVVVSFLIDPNWDYLGKKTPYVWLVVASETIATSYDKAEAGAKEGIAELCMIAGQFKEDLQAFVDALDAYRNCQERD